MALLDPLVAALGAVDGVLAGVLPELPRLIVWGVATGAAAMAVYRLTSNQERIRARQGQAKAARAALLAAAPEAPLLPLSLANLRASLALLGAVLLPGLASALPVLLVLVWLAGAWSLAAPAPGAEVRVIAEPADVALRVDPPSAARAAAGLELIWPEDPTTVRLADRSGTIVERLPDAPPVGVIAKPDRWSWLLGSPGGYLPQRAAAEAVIFELPRREVLGFGPGWLRGWEAPFLVSALLASIIIKLVFRIA